MNYSVEISDKMSSLLLQRKFLKLQNLMINEFESGEQFEDIKAILTLMLERGFSEKVIAIVKRLLKIRHEFNLFLILGKAENFSMNYNAAIGAYLKANLLKPDSVDVIFNLGVVSQKKGNSEEAINYFKKVIEIQSDSPEAYYNLGNIFRLSNEYEQAETYYRKCLELSSQNADCLYNIGVVVEKQFKYHEALEFYNWAIAINPSFVDAHWNKALLLLLLKNHKEGWREYEWRLQMKRHQRNELNFKYWNGEDLNGKKILVYDEQGFGDTIHFMRFAVLLKKKYSVAISLECKKEIYPLFKNDTNFNNLYIREEKKYYEDEFDFKVSLLSLPYLLNIKKENIKIKEPCIKIDSQNHSLKLADKDKIKLGFVWGGNPEHQNDEYRSIKIEQLITVFESTQVQLYSLQKRDKTDEKIDRLFDKYNVIDLNNRIKNFHDTAEIISQLDLVISVDTSVAHLAGAMMKPVWILLPANPDWRWELTGDKSKWYPTARLFRQKKLGEWEDVLKNLKYELNQISSEDKSTNPDKTLNTAIVFFNNKKFKKAAKNFETLIELNKHDETIYYNLAICYQKLEQFNKAVAFCNNSIKINQNYLPAYNTLAINYFKLGQIEKAIESLQIALNKDPLDQDSLFNLANIYHRTGNSELAGKYYKRAYSIAPQTSQLIYNYSLWLIEHVDYENAKSVVKNGLTEYPQEASLHFLFGNIEKYNENFESAIQSYLDVLRLEPEYIEAYLNLANTNYLLHNFKDAEQIYLSLQNNNVHDARIDYSLGVLELEKNKFDTAEKHFREAISKDNNNADFHVALAETLFSKGDYSKGWEEFDWRYKRKEFQNKSIILPNKPSDLAEKNILIYEEQGIGDTFQFIRFVKKIKTPNNKITFAARKEVQKIIGELEYIDDVVERDFVSDKFDYMFPLVSLGKFFVSDISDIGTIEKYINENNIYIQNIKKDNKLNIGICWRGNRFPVHNRKRHTEVFEFDKLFAIPSTRFYALQKDISIDEQRYLKIFNNVEDLSPKLKSFEDTARYCSEMDLIISVDTAVLHLAGAMGKDTWALLPYSSDWRWQIELGKTPWYPTMKLFMQKTIFEWRDVFDNVKEELKNYTRA